MVILSEEEVTSSFSSCSSSSSATPQWEYDVFLSFRGKDTRKNFTDHLYTALKQKGINTLRDDERIERGKPISPELLKAIEESKFAVIVLSKNYASSTWCLDELAKIVECMKERGMMIWPIFYHVNPSDVRNQTGTFGKVFAKHKESCKEKVQTWTTALTEVADLAGWHLGDRHESEVIRQIVEEIFKKLHDKFPRVTKGLVGIEHQVNELERLLCLRLNDVRVIGIWGMGGIGKTTLAKVICDNYSTNFEGCSFIKNVKDVSKESDFVRLQQQLLYEILKEENMRIWNVEGGVNIIKTRLRSKKILFVLDDVNHLDQLKYLAEERNWFGSGSRIIITTRDQHLLNAHRVDEIYECKELNDDDALKLFCFKAFKKEQPEESYEKISWKIVDYADGLPLALDVLGSLLVGRAIDHWKDILKRLKEYPEFDIFKKLEISYDGLNNEAEQRIFIYIACFLNGMNEGLVTDILKSFGLHPTSGIIVLKERSLITISDNIVWVHDLLQEMGWEILRKQSPAEPGKRIGLKLRKDIFDVLTNNEGTHALEIINQDSFVGEVENYTCSPEAFSKMTKLRFLRISNVLFPQGLEFLSNELRILEWRRYPLKSLPSNFQSKEICELAMRYSQIEKLWKEDMVFPNLRFIDLSWSENLIRAPNLTGTPSLETLDLHGCKNLVEGHLSIFIHKRLNYLNMAHCINLESLPPKIEMESLKTFTLFQCPKVQRIPEFGENMKCLEDLNLGGTAIEEIPPSIKHLTSLKYLNFFECSKLGKLPENLGEIECLENLDAITKMDSWQFLEHLCCLEDLDLSWCNLFAIPNAIGSLSSLISLNLKGNNFVMLPASISHLSKLEQLYLSVCKKLQSLPELPSNISVLMVDRCTSLEKLPDISELGNWDKTTSLLTCSDCPKLVENENDISVVFLKCHFQGHYGRKVPLALNNSGSEIPQWFTHQNEGNSISIELPPNWCDSTWLGFALCAHFNIFFHKSGYVKTSVSVFASLPNKQRICPPIEFELKDGENNQVVWYVPRYDEHFLYQPKDIKAFELLKHIDWNQCSGNIVFYFEMEGYDDDSDMVYDDDSNMDLDGDSDMEFDVKNFEVKCGVQLVYEQDVEELMQTTFQASGSSIPPLVTGTTT